MFKGISVLVIAGLWAVQALALPPLQHWETTNGARVYFVPAPELPMLDVKVVFDAASARDGDKPGLAALTSGMLEEGAGGLSAELIAEGFDNVGAQLGLEVKRDMASITLRTLTQPELLQAALKTFVTVISQPDFPPSALERVRQQMLRHFEYESQSPEAIMAKAFYAQLYAGHPYASPITGTKASVEQLSREDLQQFYATYYVARNAVIALVGDLDRLGAEQLAERISQPLSAGQPAPPLPPVSPLSKAQNVHLQHPSKQTHIQLGHIGYSRYDPDYFTLFVANYTLGGSGLVSRLFNEVREKRGLAYSTHSYFIPMRQPGPFLAGLQTRNDQTQQAVDVVRKVLQDYVAQGPTPEELSAAKKNLTGGFPLRIASNEKIVGYVAMIGFFGLPLDYLQTWTDKVEAVTLEQIKDALKRRLHPEKMLLVTVGDTVEKAETVEPAETD